MQLLTQNRDDNRFGDLVGLANLQPAATVEVFSSSVDESPGQWIEPAGGHRLPLDFVQASVDPRAIVGQVAKKQIFTIAQHRRRKGTLGCFQIVEVILGKFRRQISSSESCPSLLWHDATATLSSVEAFVQQVPIAEDPSA